MFGLLGINALQFVVALQKLLDAFGDLVDLGDKGCIRHSGLDCRRSQPFCRLESRLLVLAAWFTLRSSTGSRRKSVPCAPLSGN